MIDKYLEIEVEEETPNLEFLCIMIENVPKPPCTYVKFYDDNDSVEEIVEYQTTDKYGSEMGNMSMTFPIDQKVLNDPGFWAADTSYHRGAPN